MLTNNLIRDEPVMDTLASFVFKLSCSQMSESNPWWLVGKHKYYLCAMMFPLIELLCEPSNHILKNSFSYVLEKTSYQTNQKCILDLLQ